MFVITLAHARQPVCLVSPSLSARAVIDTTTACPFHLLHARTLTFLPLRLTLHVSITLARSTFKYGALYIKKQSFWLDLKLIGLSFWITFRGKWEHRGQKF